MSSMDVEIVLATYNGERYLPEQLDSLINQTASSAIIIVSDDGSSDQTLAIIHRYQAQYPGRLRLLPPGPSQGASANFNYLLSASKADYVFLADQDDVWDEDKLALSLAEMKGLETRVGSSTPILVHTDLRVVDYALGLVSPSFFRLQQLDKERQSLKDLMCQSVVTGCTALVNRALLNKALPVAPGAVMHDWWLSLVAAAFGQIGFVDRATISYRQHGNNTIGAKSWSVGFIADKFKRLLSPRGAANLLRPGLVQASAFLTAYSSQLNRQQRDAVAGYAGLMQAGSGRRLLMALKHGFRKQGLLRTLGFYWALLVADFND